MNWNQQQQLHEWELEAFLFYFFINPILEPKAQNTDLYGNPSSRIEGNFAAQKFVSQQTTQTTTIKVSVWNLIIPFFFAYKFYVFFA